MKVKKIIAVIFLVAAVATATFFIGRQIGLNIDLSSTNTQIEEVKVSRQTIKKTLTSSGQIESKGTEKLELSTSYYFKNVCVEEDDTIKKGTKLLKYTNGKSLKAPYDLVVSKISVPTTKTKATSSNYIEVYDLENLVVKMSVNESEISSISVGQNVEITLTSDTSKVYTGKISKIDAIGSYSSSGSTFGVEVSLENDGNIKIGMSVSCTINIEELTDVMAVPVGGVQINGNRRYVLVVEDGKTKEVDITTGLSDDTYVEVTSGLNGDETIQVVTTTKQNTIRNNSQGGNRNNFGGGSGMGNFDFSGGMPSGGSMPSRPSGGSGGGNMNFPGM